ncbi:hypothetical protein [Neobacillus drentensis]
MVPVGIGEFEISGNGQLIVSHK